MKKTTGGQPLLKKQEASMWGLVIASGVCGLLFGRYFKVYALIPATLVFVGVACFLASKQGLAIGVLSLVLAAAAMQLCYFLSAVVTVSVDNFEPAKAPSEEFPLATPKTDHDNRQPQFVASFISAQVDDLERRVMMPKGKTLA